MTNTAESLASVLVVGANHKSSAMSFRDRLFVEPADAPAFLTATGLSQALVLSTGARTDVVAIDDGAGADATIAALADHAGMTSDDVREQVYVLRGAAAIAHVFRVAATLDSVLVGDREVLDQLRAAHALATQAGRAGDALDAVVAAAAETAERVLGETDLGRTPVSIATSAVEVARDLHGDLVRCSGLLLGGGDAREDIIGEMQAAGMKDVTVAHPSAQRADATARALGGHSVALDDLGAALAAADVVVTALDRTQRTITQALVKDAIKARRYKPLFIVDAGVPGDVDPAVDGLDEAFVYTPDDLERVAVEFRARHKDDTQDAVRRVELAAKVFAGDEDAGEAARAEALAAAGGDADKATRLLLDRLKGLWGALK